jgi:hypothetical protein
VIDWGIGLSTSGLPNNHKVFAAYARADLDRVQPILRRIERAGIDVTYDIASLSVGDNFGNKIMELIREADTVLFMLSPSSLRSHWCMAEANLAGQLGKRILPVKVVETSDRHLPPDIAKYQYLNGSSRRKMPEFSCSVLISNQKSVGFRGLSFINVAM